jgi:DNA-binding GntR family transcriptional regulator
MSSDQIVEDLAERIRRGEYEPGEQLPSYRQLMAMYSVSHGTVALVVKLLKASGVVVGRRGRGVFVAEAVARPKKRTAALRSPFEV